MAEPIKPLKLIIPPEIKATILEQEKQLEKIKLIRDTTRELGEATTELDKQIEIAELIIKSSKDVIARSERA